MQPVGTKPTVIIHTNDRQMVAALVSAHSLKSRSKSPHLFDVRLLRLEETPHLYKRDIIRPFVLWEGDAPSVWRRRDLQSFAPLRRLVPALLGFQGRALVIDPDIFAIGDVYELLKSGHGRQGHPVPREARVARRPAPVFFRRHAARLQQADALAVGA